MFASVTHDGSRSSTGELSLLVLSFRNQLFPNEIPVAAGIRSPLSSFEELPAALLLLCVFAVLRLTQVSIARETHKQRNRYIQ